MANLVLSLVPQKVDEFVVMSEMNVVLALPTMIMKVPSAWKFVLHPIGIEVGKALGQGVIDGKGVGVGEAIPVNVGNGEAGGPSQIWID